MKFVIIALFMKLKMNLFFLNFDFLKIPLFNSKYYYFKFNFTNKISFFNKTLLINHIEILFP